MRRAKYTDLYMGSAHTYSDLVRERAYSNYLVKALKIIAGPMPFDVTEQNDLNKEYARELGVRMQIAQKALCGEMFLSSPDEQKPKKVAEQPESAIKSTDPL